MVIHLAKMSFKKHAGYKTVEVKNIIMIRCNPLKENVFWFFKYVFTASRISTLYACVRITTENIEKK